jgi:hypothetical protein
VEDERRWGLVAGLNGQPWVYILVLLRSARKAAVYAGELGVGAPGYAASRAKADAQAWVAARGDAGTTTAAEAVRSTIVGLPAQLSLFEAA